MAKVWISIGSNINRDKNIRIAIAQLKQYFQSIDFSPVYKTKAVGFIGRDFYNLVGGFSTELTIHQLRDLFDQLEQLTGRIKTTHHFENRTLDIDILLYDDMKYKDERISIPHPDVLNYDFILTPLSELAPNFIHPDSGISLSEHATKQRIEQHLTIVNLSP